MKTDTKMNTKEIIENRDFSKFLKLKRKELIAFLNSFGITEGRITGKYTKNMDQSDLRSLCMNLIKEQREAHANRNSTAQDNAANQFQLIPEAEMPFNLAGESVFLLLDEGERILVSLSADPTGGDSRWIARELVAA